MKTSIGIDIGTENIKVVCLEHYGSAHKLAGYGKLPFKADKGKLASFLSSSGVPLKDIRVNIEDPSMKVRRLDLPVMPPDELPEAVRWGMKGAIEGDVESFEFRFIEISPDDLTLAGKKPYLVYAVRSAVVTKQVEFMRSLGIKNASIIEPNTSALSCIFEGTKGASRETYDVLIDFGSALALFVVMGKKGMLFSRPLVGCADSNLIDQIVRDTGFDLKKAEALRAAYYRGEDLGLGEESQRLLKNTIAHFFAKVALEIQRSIDGFMLVFERKKINRIYMCGGGAYQTGLLDYLKQTLGIECVGFDPFEKIDTSAFRSERLESTKMTYAVACGLAVD